MIIWLASYPKSGNTWVRSIISSLLYTNDGIFNFDLLDKIQKFPKNNHFREFTNDIENFEEIQKYWIPAQEKLNTDKKIKFLKTHHINCKINQYYFTNKENTLATIYIVRDPRNLINSISNHYNKSVNDAKDFLLKPRFIMGHKKDEPNKKFLKTLLGTWSEHYNFWKKDNNDFLLIKYEDLIDDTEKELKKIIEFLKKYIKITTDDIKNKNIIQSTSFKKLQSLEEQGKFHENAHISSTVKKKFFYLGPKNRWEKNLEREIKEEIENKFLAEMKELGYLK